MILKLYFKNVGQGDTIILEWTDKETQNEKFGLIDCNLVNNGIVNVIEHIKKKNIRVFDFVIMSHPHSDHFSGFPMFFEYCETNMIVINKFLYTTMYDPIELSSFLKKEISQDDHFEIIRSSVNSYDKKNLLTSLFLKVDEQVDKWPKGFIKDFEIIANDRPFKLNNEVSLRFLAPHGHFEFREYLKRNYEITESEKFQLTKFTENNPTANLLSTFIQIYDTDRNWQVILCSDSTNFTFDRLIVSSNLESLNKNKIHVIQIPHHGSEYNHNSNFWNSINELGETHSIISVGKGYGHPSIKVVDYFMGKCKMVHSTNFVGGYKEHFTNRNERNKEDIFESATSMPGITADSIQSSMSSQTPMCGEKVFTIISDDNSTTCHVQNL